MATVKGLGSVRAAFAKILSQIDSPESMRKLGGFVIKTIRERTRGQGKGVRSPGGQATNLKRVSNKYAKWRLKQPRHPEAATGNKSNLTLSGKMLDGMIIKNATKSKLFIGFRANRDEKKAQYQEEQGRRFLVLSGKEIKDAANFVKTILKRK